MAEGKKWFLYGCLGCLGLAGLVILTGAIVSGIAFMQVRNEKVQDHVSQQELPAPVLSEAVVPGRLEPTPVPGQVRLVLNRAEFEIEPLRPGEQMRVEATYDKNGYVLTESLEVEEGAGWTYDVQFGSTGNNLIASIRQMFGGSQPKIRVFLPADIPIRLEVLLSQGGGTLDLGGMWLTELDLQLNQGGFEVVIDEPLYRPAERITLQGSMGGIEFERLGNASPRRLDVDFGMGGLELDLRGQWLNDSEIHIETRMSGAVVRLPRNVLIEGLSTDGFRPPEDVEIAPPTLRFTTSSDKGELQVIY